MPTDVEPDMAAISEAVQTRIDELAEDNMLTRQMITTNEFMKGMSTRGGMRDFAYRTFYDAVLALGHYQFTDEYYVPETVEMGVPKRCFANAAELALERPEEFTYCEGYACTEKAGIAIAHAWVEDSDGRIVDHTWGALPYEDDHKRAHYFGIKFSEDYLRYRWERDDEFFGGLLGEDWMYLEHMRKGMITDDEGVVIGEKED